MATVRLAKLRAAPLGMMALLALAAALYVALLVTSAAPLEGGEASYSQAWGALLLTFWLWVVLALALVVGAAMGRMPLAAGIAALLLHPISGVAAFVAIDAVSRHVAGALGRRCAAAAADRVLRLVGAPAVAQRQRAGGDRRRRRLGRRRAALRRAFATGL